MWVFGYGSLIWDNWETQYGCLRKRKATICGYKRSFNKASIINWGTKENPAPTLNIVPASGCCCQGIAFEFPEDKAPAVMAFLKRREGKGFEFPEHSIRFGLFSDTKAIVPIYCGKGVLHDQPLDTLADLALRSVGQNGKCVDYILNLQQ